MPKYRPLTMKEMEPLEKEFVQFLIINGITKDDWVKIKEEDSDRAEGILASFSDTVFEKILRETKYLNKVEAKTIFCFKCDEVHISVIILTTKDPSYDFTKDGIKRAIDQPPADLKIMKQSKSYRPSREEELYKMMNMGCLKSDGVIYRTLEKENP